MLSDVLIRLRSLFRRNKVEGELSEELRFHLERESQKYLERGLPPEEAMRRARIELGGLDQVKEECRDARGVRLAETVVQDVRYGVRMLSKTPAFTATALLTLALGIGANTAIFSLLNGLVLRDLPVPHPEQLVRVGTQNGDDPDAGLSLPMFEEIGRDQRVFSSMLAWWGDSVNNVEANGALTRADIWAISGNFQSELGAVPAIGRLLEPEDVNLRSAAPAQVAVLAYGFWQRQYGGARDIIGKTIKIEGLPFTVVGVTSESFRGITAEGAVEVMVPLTAEPLIVGKPDVQRQLGRRDALWLEAAGRLKSDATLGQARAELEAQWPAIREDMLSPEQTAAQRTRLLALHLKIESGAKGGSFLRGRFLYPLQILLMISGLVVLVACVNLASLILARAATRSHELGVRVALGAGRARLVRQMLTESVTLSVAGTLAGVAFAHWGSRALADFILGEIYLVPATLNLSPDLRVLGFTAAVAILTGLLFGMVPAWKAWREDPIIALQQNSRTIGAGAGRLGKGLIVAQVALSVVLLTGAGLFVRSLAKLRAAEPGFHTRGVLVLGLFPVPGGYKNLKWVDYYHELTDRVSSLPGVASAGMIHMEPASVVRWTEQARITGTDAAGAAVDFEMVTPGALGTVGIALMRGRNFAWQDDEHAPRVALVSQSFAEKFFPGGDPIGKRLDVVTEPKWQGLEIVGIVSDASLYDVRAVRPPTVYAPTMQYGDYMGWSEMLVETRNSPAAMSGALRRTVESLGHESVWTIRTMEEGIDRSLLRERVTGMLSSFFGAVALLLAAVGLYGLMAYTVTQRTHEIGIRMALGAQRSTVRGMVIGETFALTGLGLAVGVPCAIGAARMLASMLYGVAAYDLLTLAGVSLALIAVAALAGFIPARRATRVDPMVALRYE